MSHLNKARALVMKADAKRRSKYTDEQREESQRLQTNVATYDRRARALNQKLSRKKS